MTLDELKELELPAKLVCCDGYYEVPYRHVTVTAFNERYMLVIANNDLNDFLSTQALVHYKPAPKMKRIVVERWISIYPGDEVYMYSSKENADLSASKDRIACEHIKFEYEINEETGEVRKL